MKRFPALLLLTWMTAGSVWADLQDLKKDVQTSEQSKDKKAPEAAPASTPASGSSNDGFGAFVAKVVALLWAADNVGTTFGAHPYDEHGWVRIAPWTAATDPTSPPLLTGRDQWWSAEAQVFSLDGLGTGVWTAWKGHLWRFFGPSFEGWTLTDGAQLLSGGRAGLTFSLVQGDPFNLSVYLQAQGWTGALVRGGGSGGLELRSYPLDPLEVQVRLGVQGFDGFQIGEFEAQAGWNFGAITAFGGFRSWGLGDGSAKPPTSVYAGPFGGVRWYF